LASNDLSGWNFAGQNLTNADFSYYFCFMNSCGFATTRLTDVDLTGADARGAKLSTTGAITANLILPDGHISGLDLDAGGRLVVRDYDGNPNSFPPTNPIPLTVDQHLAIVPGGTLELTFADDVNLASQLGRTFDLFNWTGVIPTGAFAISSPDAWDLSNLYTTGQITLTAIPEPATVVPLALAAGMCAKRRRT
jgi:uncharacterized protein YjbI with pentapeptide repeats